MTDAKKLFVKTYGCQMNVYDSERMAEAWAPKGYVTTEVAEDADMVLLNTCHIREKASREAVLRPWPAARAEGWQSPDLKVGVAGCVAQAEGDEILRRSPVVDLVVGPQAYHRLPEMVAAGGRQVDTEFPVEDKFTLLPARKVPARADGLSDRAGRLRQVLRLLRGALHPRGRGQPPGRAPAGRGAGPGGARRARDHASGPERQRLSRRRGRTGPGAWRGCCASWPGSTGWSGCAIPPATPTTWKTT